MAAIIERVELSNKVGVCLDTCHIWDGGYDIAGNLDGVLEELDRVIGLSRLRAIHLNNSKNPPSRPAKTATLPSARAASASTRWLL